MSAELSILTYAPGATPFVLIDGEPQAWSLMPEADWGNAAWDHVFSGPRGTQGARPAQGTPANRTVILPLKVIGSTQDEAAARLSELHSVADELRRFGGKITRRAHSQTYRQYFEVMVADHRVGEWGRQAEYRGLYKPMLTAVCAPYVLGDPMGFRDDFATDGSASDYEVVQGAGTLTVTNGWLDTASAAVVRALESRRGYRYGDVYLRAELTTAAAQASSDQSVGVILRWVDSSNFIEVCAENRASGATKVLTIRVVLAGVERLVDVTRDATTTGLNGIREVVVGWIDGNRIVAEHHPQWSGDSPYNSLASGDRVTTNTHLTAAEAAVLGARTTSRVGLKIDRHSTTSPNVGAETIRSFEVRPYYLQGYTWPQLGSCDLNGAIPGDVPALVDASVTIPSSASVPPRFALLGWTSRPRVWNYLWNGGAESPDLGTDGWSTAIVSGVIAAAATSITRSTAAPMRGTGLFTVVTPATISAGVSFLARGRFRRGFTYRATALVAGTPSGGVALVAGVSGDLAVSSTLVHTASTTLQQISVDWTPAADTNIAYVGLRNVTASAGAAILLDAVTLVEGTTAPPDDAQAEGTGGYPPLYALPAQAAQEIVGLGTTTSDASCLSGNRRETTSIAGAGSVAVGWIVDPALIAGDDYSLGEIDVEVWVRVRLDGGLVGVRALAWANPADAAYDSDLLGQRRYTRRHGERGRPVTVPSTGDQYRIVRVGVVPMVVDRSDPTAWRLTVQFTYQAGSSNSIGIDFGLVLPSRARVLSPTGEDRSLGGYPDFVSAVGTEITRLIRSDLSGATGRAALRSRFPDHGLGGSSLLELPPGEVSVNLLLSDQVPDDPGSNTNGAAGLPAATLQITPTPRWAILRDS